MSDSPAATVPTRPSAPVQTPLSRVAAFVRAPAPAGAEVIVTGLALGSAGVRPGDLYAALPGARRHGAEFVAEAVARGAVAVLTDEAGRALAGSADVPVLVVADPRRLLGGLAAALNGRPADDLLLLGVTGTQGKTTTTRLLESGLSGAGVPAAVVGTVGTRIAGVDVPSALTTPEAPDLHALFAVMRERGVRACAMEVSSHALVMGRVDGVVFDVAAFTNLGRDHLDFHDTVEEYFAAKASLFTPERARRGLTNLDDAHGRALLERATVPMATFSTFSTFPTSSTGDPTADPAADWRAVDVRAEAGGSTFRVLGPGGLDLPGGVPLPGRFNVANALCAIALAGEAGLDPAAVAAGIAAGPGVPGRLERVDAGQEFLAVVDYAHKPDAVAAVLDTLRAVGPGRLIVVLGAGGDRDTGKRAAMGRLAAERADVLVVSDDNPRSEDPARIRAALVAGAGEVPLRERAQVVEIGDRREAIRQAVALATSVDVVLVAGKGHETGQEVDGTVHPFDDRVELRRALEECR